MNKKLIALAVASALGTPAAALAASAAPGASTVQIYGTMYLEDPFADQGSQFPAGSGDLVNVDLFQTPGSNIGFKGEEALGGGMSAWFQCESTADIRGQSQNGWCSRNSAIGFKGGFGNLFLGNWDTPFKRTGGITGGVVNETGIFGRIFLLTGGSTTDDGRVNPGQFNRRSNSSINYDTPNFGGFQAMFQATTMQSTTGGSLTATTGESGAKPRLWSVGAQYINGPLAIAGAWEQHKNFWPGGGTYSGRDRGWHLGAAYTFPVGGGLKLAGLYTRQKFQMNAAGAETRRSAWQVGADWKIVGPHGVRGAYTKAGDSRGSFTAPAGTLIAGTGVNAGALADTGADMWQIWYYYTFSRCTEVGVGYVRLDNDNNARYSLGGLANPALGNNQDAFAIFTRHTF